MNTKILVADLNPELTKALYTAGLPVVLGDYFLEANKVAHPVLMTASNPRWTFGGGIDASFVEKYPFLVRTKQFKGGGMERIGNICFCISVDEKYNASYDTVFNAIDFALSQCCEHETLVVSGIGTGIGGISIPTFAEALINVRKKYA